jgi:hypothetical protein
MIGIVEMIRQGECGRHHRILADTVQVRRTLSAVRPD